VPVSAAHWLSDHGLQFTNLPHIGSDRTSRYRPHPFGKTCMAPTVFGLI
jgi:hypothetical protein